MGSHAAPQPRVTSRLAPNRRLADERHAGCCKARHFGALRSSDRVHGAIDAPPITLGREAPEAQRRSRSGPRPICYGRHMGKSRAFILLVVCLASLVAPALPCLAVAMVPARSGLDLALLFAAAATWMTLLALVAWWEFTGLFLRWAWWTALVTCAVVRWLRAPAPGATLGPAGIGAGVALILAVALLAPALRGRRHPGDS